MNISVFLDKTKVVEFEILYNSGVHGLRDKFSNDQLYPKYFLTYIYICIYIFLLNFCFDAAGPWAPPNRLLNFFWVALGPPKLIFGAPGP